MVSMSKVTTACTSFIDERTNPWRPATIFWLALAILLTSGCAREQRSLPQATVSAIPGGLAIELTEPAPLACVLIHDENGALVQELPTAGTRRRYELPVKLQPDVLYEVTLCFPSRESTLRWKSPPPTGPILARLEIPLGQDAAPLVGNHRTLALASPEGKLSLAVILENGSARAIEYRLTWQLPPELNFRSSDPRVSYSPNEVVIEGTFAIAGDFLQLPGELELASAATSAEVTCRLEFAEVSAQPDALDWQTLGTIVVEVVRGDPEELRHQVELVAINFPSDLAGEPLPQFPRDVINLPNPLWHTLRRWLLPTASGNPYEAYGWESVILANRGGAALNLLIESEVAATPDGEALLEFAPPLWYSSRRAATQQQVLRLAPNSQGVARFPLHVEAGTTPGEYVRRVRVLALGSREPLWEFTRPLGVRGGRPLVALVTVVTCVLCLIVWCLMPWLTRRWQKPLGTSGLALIGLVASVHFAISFTFRLVGDLSASLLGPLAIFVAGIGHEALSTALIAALLVLLPRPGTFSLSVLTLFLLNAMFTGQLGISDFLFVTVSLIWGETLLAAAGVTRGSAFFAPGAEAPRGNIWRMAFALGVANLGTLAVQFCLVQVLHRLYYATWYVMAVAIVTGLIYGSIGGALGTKLGYRIRRASR